jgi:hypothetical protein
MSFDREILDSAHKRSIYNEGEIKQSVLCGCFYCLETFKSIEIIEWIDKESAKGKTAQCPNCGIDSVIGDKSGFPVMDKNFLIAMYGRWFN